MPSRFLISAAHKSSGKTTLSIGLAAAYGARGRCVQTFKKGPDYIDPMWLGVAAGRACYNLDFYVMAREEIRDLFARHARDSEVVLVEGNKGLYDGLDLEGSNSNAALASLLNLPVILVIDARGMTRGIAPLILGYQAFDRALRIAGVILNRVGGSRHEGKLRAVIEHYTDVPVLGAVHEDASLQIHERHLGLVPSNEAALAREQVDRIAARVAAQVDLDRLLDVTRDAGASPAALPRSTPQPAIYRVGILRDRAFGFYYADDLEALAAAGAELLPIDAMADAALPPDLDGLILGGGFPESFMGELEANVGLRGQIGAAIEAGLPAYAECGGLMYLARSLSWRGERRAMVGVIPGDVVMHDKPVGRGYVRLRHTGHGPWGAAAGQEVLAHEFHYSSLENLPSGVEYAYQVERGHGVDGRNDGIVYRNLLASYTHLRSTRSYSWVEHFMALVAKHAAGANRSGRLPDGTTREEMR